MSVKTPTRLPAIALASVLLLLSTGPVQPRAADASAADLRVVDELIIPGYRRLAGATDQLARSAEAFCERPDPERLSAVRAAYHAAADAWQAIRPVRFGPVEDDLRFYRFQLWPDKRGTVQRHLSRLLAGQDPAALQPEQFAKATVAIQGFGALERLLFPASEVEAAAFLDGDAPNFRCALVQAITANLAAMSRAVAQAWSQGDSAYRRHFVTADQGNAVFADRDAATGLLFHTLRTQLEAIPLEKLQMPLGSERQWAKPKRAESWRSGRSLRNVGLALEAAAELYRVGFAGRIDDAGLRAKVERRFDQARRSLAEIEAPLPEAVTDAEQRRRVEALGRRLEALNETLRVEVTEALGIPVAFNSLDGD